MIAALKPYYKMLDDIDRDVEGQTHKIISRNQQEIIDLNTKEQLFKGESSSGQKLSPKYTGVRYARAKNKVNPLPGYGTPDLKFTGKFYNDFFLSTKGRQLEFDSKTKYAKHLESKYGSEIYGLNKDNSDWLNDKLLFPELLGWVLTRIKI